MRGVKDKTVQMVNQLGMSDNILTLIERRSKTDLLILIGLCVLTLVIIYVLYAYVKPMMSLSYLMSSGTTVSSEPVVTPEIQVNATL